MQFTRQGRRSSLFHVCAPPEQHKIREINVELGGKMNGMEIVFTVQKMAIKAKLKSDRSGQ